MNGAQALLPKTTKPLKHHQRKVLASNAVLNSAKTHRVKIIHLALQKSPTAQAFEHLKLKSDIQFTSLFGADRRWMICGEPGLLLEKLSF